MILESVFGLSLVLNVSLESQIPTAGRGIAWGQPSVIERQAELLPAIARATECILRRIADDPRYSAALRPGEINDLIANSLRGCARPLRALIDTYDRMYGPGSGEAFLLGPFLDVLPSAVVHQVKARRSSQ
jgi:hypothetical protein